MPTRLFSIFSKPSPLEVLRVVLGEAVRAGQSSEGGERMIESIQEPIEVLVRFAGGRIEPFRFRWNQSVFRIAKVTGAWEDREGQYRRLHFSVLTDNDDYFELRFHSGDFMWVLSKASLDG